MQSLALTGNPDFQTGFNLMLCYFALGDSEKMKRGFSRLITIPIPGMAEDEDDDEVTPPFPFSGCTCTWIR